MSECGWLLGVAVAIAVCDLIGCIRRGIYCPRKQAQGGKGGDHPTSRPHRQPTMDGWMNGTHNLGEADGGVGKGTLNGSSELTVTMAQLITIESLYHSVNASSSNLNST